MHGGIILGKALTVEFSTNDVDESINLKIDHEQHDNDDEWHCDTELEDGDRKKDTNCLKNKPTTQVWGNIITLQKKTVFKSLWSNGGGYVVMHIFMTYSAHFMNDLRECLVDYQNEFSIPYIFQYNFIALCFLLERWSTPLAMGSK